jgi:hypothetical protein
MEAGSGGKFVGNRHHWRSIILAGSIVPGIASAQTVIEVAPLPPVRIAAEPDYRLENLGLRSQQTATGKAAMLERLFAPAAGFGLSDHRHVRSFAIGGIQLSGEAMRERMLTATGGSGRGARVLERRWVAGVHADWAMGASDSLSLGVAADKSKRAEADILPGRTHIKGNAFVGDLTWAHSDHLQMSLGWRSDRSKSHSGAERLVEIAQGAALQEQGFHLDLRYKVGGRDPSHAAVIGIAAQAARVAADDLASIGPFNRRDTQASLFFRTAL